MPDDERVIALREQLATAASERDHARRERDQALRLVDNLRKQLHEERAASASATSAAVSVASDTSEGGDSAMTAEHLHDHSRHLHDHSFATITAATSPHLLHSPSSTASRT